MTICERTVKTSQSMNELTDGRSQLGPNGPLNGLPIPQLPGTGTLRCNSAHSVRFFQTLDARRSFMRPQTVK